MSITDLFTAFFYGIVEGITEWLPISSTGHLIILEDLIPLPLGNRFKVLFDVVIQFFAVLAVVTVYAKKLDPFTKSEKLFLAHDKIRLWAKIIIAVMPSAVVGLFLDEIIEEYLFNSTCGACCLIIYGCVFMFIERRSKMQCTDISKGTALKIGFFQALALVPGTSRSGATIVGGLLCGLTRESAAEFSFFMSLPTMLGASCLKLIKYFLVGYNVSTSEIVFLFAGGASAYFVSLLVIRYLIDFLKKHSFRAFGIYRILLGVIILIYVNFERI